MLPCAVCYNGRSVTLIGLRPVNIHRSRIPLHTPLMPLCHIRPHDSPRDLHLA